MFCNATLDIPLLVLEFEHCIDKIPFFLAIVERCLIDLRILGHLWNPSALDINKFTTKLQFASLDDFHVKGTVVDKLEHYLDRNFFTAITPLSAERRLFAKQSTTPLLTDALLFRSLAFILHIIFTCFRSKKYKISFMRQYSRDIKRATEIFYLPLF